MDTALWVAAAAGVAGFLTYSMFHEPYACRLDERTLTFTALPPSLDGLRVLFIGDLHLRRWDFRTVWARAVAARADAGLVLLTGDIVEHTGRRCLAEFLDAVRPPFGAYFVPGNNENEERDRENLFATFEAHGVRVVRNEAVTVGADLRVAGVDDPSRERDRLDVALAAREPGGFTILLSHTPEVFPAACRAGVPLTLAGHTHGGQVRLPLIGALWTDTPRTGRRYDCGHFTDEESQLVVTRGVGMSKLPLRCLCPPEIHVLTLRRGGVTGQ